MKRFAGAVAILAAALAVPSVGAGGPQPLAFALTDPGNGNIQNPVEQESPDYFGGPREHPETWVHNPTPCVWDVDDHWGISAFGYLRAGETATASICVIADEYDNFGGDDKTVDALVAGDALAVTMSDSLGHTWAAVKPDADHHLFCHTEEETGPFSIIEDSNGGTGLRIDYTLTISASKRSNSIAVYLSAWGWLREFGSITHCPNKYQPGNPGF